jgi:hypothetical protein
VWFPNGASFIYVSDLKKAFEMTPSITKIILLKLALFSCIFTFLTMPAAENWDI